MKRTVALLLLIFLIASSIEIKSVSASTVTENTWVSKTPMPTARADLGVAVVNGKIYAIGGTVLVYQDALRTDSKEVGVNEVYDPATNTWTTKKPMPIPSSNFAVAVYQNKIYCMGGGVTDFYNVSKGNWDVKLGTGFNQVYDPATDKWENRTSMPFPEINSQANVVNGKIYLLGGHLNATLNEVYDPINDNWTLRAPMPTRFYGASTVYSDKIYVVGSHEEGGYFDSNDNYVPRHVTPMTQIYDPQNDTWILKDLTGHLSSGKSFASTTTGITAPQKIYVFYNPSNAPNSAIYENQVYDPETGSSENGAGIPTQRNSFAVAVVDDLIYVVGGLTITFPIPTVGTNPTSVTTIHSTNEQYTPFNYGSISPKISIASPQNLTYSSNDISLSFSLNKGVNWTGYSLDGKENVTVNGNVSISKLSVGAHNITVYSQDTFGNIGGSQTISFAIAATFPTLLIATVVGVTVLGICVGVVIYFKKRHKVT